MPCNELVVLQVDVVTSAAGIAFVCLLVEFDQIASGRGSAVNKFSVDLRNKVVPLCSQINHDLVEDVLAALLASLTNVGQMDKTSSPVVNEFLGNALSKILSLAFFKELLAAQGFPISVSKIIANEHLDVVLAPHVVNLLNLIGVDSGGGSSWLSDGSDSVSSNSA